MANKAAKTGSGPAAVLAIEQYFPEDKRLINDDMAGRILPFTMGVYVWLTRASWVRNWLIRMSEKIGPGAWAMIPCRKRYIDDKVTVAVTEGVATVVNLGAGFDTLAFRLPALNAVQYWEIDQSMNIDAKRTKLKKVLGTLLGSEEEGNKFTIFCFFRDDRLISRIVFHNVIHSHPVNAYFQDGVFGNILNFLAKAVDYAVIF